MNVIDEVAEPHRSTLVAVLQEQAPGLLADLRVSTLPTFRQWVAVTDAVVVAMADHYGPGHEPDETGKTIDNALGAFLLRWPNDNLADFP